MTRWLVLALALWGCSESSNVQQPKGGAGSPSGGTNAGGTAGNSGSSSSGEGGSGEGVEGGERGEPTGGTGGDVAGAGGAGGGEGGTSGQGGEAGAGAPGAGVGGSGGMAGSGAAAGAGGALAGAGGSISGAGVGGAAGIAGATGGAAGSGGAAGVSGAGGTPCECSTGTCCDGCRFRRSNYLCGEFVYESHCVGNQQSLCSGYTTDISREYRNLFCTGTSSECGRWSQPLREEHSPCDQNGAPVEVCIDDGPGLDSARCAVCPN